MKNRLALKISVYVGVLILANYLVFWFGPNGLLISSALLIPFDFVIRCDLHERWTGRALFKRLAALVLLASTLTFAINPESASIAAGSALAFIGAQGAASLFYQITIRSSFFVKVNGSDLVGILIDSILFQAVAFGVISWTVTGTQVGLKMAGGLFWYYIIFIRMNHARTFDRNTPG